MSEEPIKPYAELDKIKTDLKKDDNKKIDINTLNEEQLIKIIDIINGFEHNIEEVSKPSGIDSATKTKIDEANKKIIKIEEDIVALEFFACERMNELFSKGKIENLTKIDELITEINESNKELDSIIKDLPEKSEELKTIKKEIKEYQKQLSRKKKIAFMKAKTLKIEQIKKYNAKIKHTNAMLAEMKKKYPENTTLQAMPDLKTLDIKEDSITATTTKYYSNIDYSKIDDRITALTAIDSTIKDFEYKEEETKKEFTTFDEMEKEIKRITNNAKDLDKIIDMLYKKTRETSKEELETRKDKIVEEYKTISEIVEKAKSEGKIDEPQYNTLKTKLDDLKSIIEKLKNQEVNIRYEKSIASGINIDSVEEDIENLKNEIDAKTEKFTSKEMKEIYDKSFRILEEKIDILKNDLEKETDPAKKEEISNRLAKAEQKLSEVKKAYISKCPLRVRTVKKAKEFYRKYPKITMLAVGIAAFAIAHVTVGPVLIPLIMKGNIVLINKAPAILKPLLIKVNRVLAKLIGATLNNNHWILKNGTTLFASKYNSILSGITMSLLGTAGLTHFTSEHFVKPLIDIKGITEEVKRLVAEITKKDPEKAPAKDEPTVTPATPATAEKPEKTSDDIKFLKEIEKLIKAYKKEKDKMTIEEFCEKYKVADEYREILISTINRDKSKGEGGRSK